MTDIDEVPVDSAITAGRPGWRSAIQGMGDRILGAMLGIDTAQSVDHAGLGFDATAGNPYQPSNWVNLFNLYRLLRQMDVTSANVFADFGCGKGLVLLLAARFPFGRIIGIDLSAAMIEVAERNIGRRSKAATRHRFELVHSDGAVYPIPPDLDTCYFYRTFPPEIFDLVLANLAASAASHPREIRLIFLHPRPADASVTARHGFRELRRLRRLALYSNHGR